MDSVSDQENGFRELQHRLRRFFAERDEVEAVYLFGSVAAGQSGASSDVDLGLLFAAGFEPSFPYLGRLRTDLEHELKGEVDLVDLGRASPILRMQVLRKGVLVLDHEGKAAGHFFVRTINEYFDLKRIRRPIERRMASEEPHG